MHFQVRCDPLQEAAVRVGAASHPHADPVQGELQVRGAAGARRGVVGAAAGRGVLEDRQVLPHLLPHPLLHLQHHLLDGFHLIVDRLFRLGRRQSF